MHIVVVGAGPAGLTAAYRLRQAGHDVEVLEAGPIVGGRTHAEHFAPGHHCDTGAGWLASFYTRTLALLDDLNLCSLLLPRAVRGADDLWVGGAVYPLPFTPTAVAASALLTAPEKAALLEYRQRLAADLPAALAVDLAYDDRDALTELAPLGAGVTDVVMRPTFEGPFFTPLEQMSAAMMRAWLRGLLDVTFYQVEGGMDAPWLRLAGQLTVRTGDAVRAIRRIAPGVEVVADSGRYTYDGVVLAVPAPAAARLLQKGGGLEPAPRWVGEVQYAPQVRLYAARPATDDVDIGVNIVPPGLVASVELSSGRHGAWGSCPDDWQWALVCAHGSASGSLLDGSTDAVMHQLWDEAQRIVPQLFSLHEAAVVHLIRWPWAIPVMGPGYYTRLRSLVQHPPIVLAGDWLQQACVEGAVRSGEAAAAVFGAA